MLERCRQGSQASCAACCSSNLPTRLLASHLGVLQSLTALLPALAPALFMPCPMSAPALLMPVPHPCPCSAHASP